MTRRVAGMLMIDRQQGEYALPSMRLADIDVSRSGRQRDTYFAVWFEMLRLAHNEDRILMSKDTGNTAEEVAAWQWLAQADVVTVVEGFELLPVLGKGAVYYSGTVLALPPSLQ